jgi:hypothetical protein
MSPHRDWIPSLSSSGSIDFLVGVEFYAAILDLRLVISDGNIAD